MKYEFPRLAAWLGFAKHFLQLAAVAESPAYPNARKALRAQLPAIYEKLKGGASLAECHAQVVAEGLSLPLDEFCCFLKEIGYEIFEEKEKELKAIADEVAMARYLMKIEIGGV